MIDTFPRQNARTRRFTCGAPRNFSIAADGSVVLFLRSASGDDPVNSLWALDTASGDERIIVDPRDLGANDGALTAAEQARRERAREAGGGIVTYHATPDASKVCFVLAGRLYVAVTATGETAELSTPGNAFDPQFDASADRVAYVSGTTLRLTGPSGDALLIGDDRSDAPDPDGLISWGSAEFVAAEEMGRGRGFWWSSDARRLLVARVDSNPIEEWHIAAPVDPAESPRSIRYPQAGTANAIVDLAIIGLDGSRLDVDWRSIEGKENPEDQENKYEYLASAAWGSRDKPWLVVQTRDQRTLAVLEVDPETGHTTEVHSQTNDAWVELMSGVPRWSGNRLITMMLVDDTVSLALDGKPFTPAGLQVRRLLQSSSDDVVVAGGFDATEIQLFRIGFDGEVTALTEEPGIHSGVVSRSGAVIISATMDTPGSTATFRPVGDGDHHVIASNREEPVLTPKASFHTATERSINTAVLLPQGEHAAGSLPVLLDPYGGPHALRVQKAQSAMYASQWFADQGFAVIVTDGRGTPGRGPAWEREVLGDLAAPVLDDQIDVLHELAGEYPQFDLNRVGIRGWSFGGYLAALAVLRRPDVFHAAIAGAPVTEWRLYDTHYTERYLGHPSTDAEAYDRSSLLPLAPLLERPLLMIHGLADDNVVAAHTLQLSRALLESGRAHQVLPLSGVTHMTPQEEVAENLLLLQVEFLRESLGSSPS